MASPTPDPTSLREYRRAKAGELETLPAQRTGAVPPFPLPKPSARERTLWRRLWAKPQAIVWERLGLEYEVAMHVRTSVECESPGANASLRALALRQASSLLLTERALLAGGYRINSAANVSSKPASSAAEARRAQLPSSRGRLQAVPDARHRPSRRNADD